MSCESNQMWWLDRGSRWAGQNIFRMVVIAVAMGDDACVARVKQQQ